MCRPGQPTLHDLVRRKVFLKVTLYYLVPTVFPPQISLPDHKLVAHDVSDERKATP